MRNPLLWFFGLLWAAGAPGPAAAVPEFQEIWGYLAPGAEKGPVPPAPVTDWAFFGPTLNSQGDLVSLPNAKAVAQFPGRKHLVLAVVDNAALTHMAVYPAFPVRTAVIEALAVAARPYDGVQIDFEAVTTADKGAFWSFLKALKNRLGSKTLSLALPARTRVVDDPYSYTALAAIADRIIIMAYDEHWSGSRPGPIASLDWGVKVAQFAKTKIAPGKLVMGVPLYGRSWAERTLSRAHTFPGVATLLKDKDVVVAGRTESIPYFEYEESVKVRVYYEDKGSQAARLSAYAAAGISKVAFWRIGQEDPGVWSVLAALPVPRGPESHPASQAPMRTPE